MLCGTYRSERYKTLGVEPKRSLYEAVVITAV